MFQFFTFDNEHRRRMPRLGQPCGDIVWLFNGRFFPQFDYLAIADLGRESGAGQDSLRCLDIARPNQQTAPPLLFEFGDVQFLQQAPLVNDADPIRKPRHFSQDVA